MENSNQNFPVADVKNFLNKLAANKDFLYIIQPFSIGDFFYSGGLSLDLQKRKNKRACVLIVRDRMKNLGVSYSNIAGIIYLSNKTMDTLRDYFYITQDYEGDNYIYGHFKNFGKDSELDNNLNLIDRYKKNVFSLPLDTKFLDPVVESITSENMNSLKEKYLIDKNRTVILLPYTHSTRAMGNTFWETIAKNLKQKNYVVYTNVDGISEQPVLGTDGIVLNFKELYFISDKVKCFIGSRVGVFDFLAITKAKILNINPFPKWFWDVGVLYPNCNNRTFYDASKYMSPVMNYFRNTQVSAKLEIRQDHIDSRDIYFSHEDILKAILVEVEQNWNFLI